MVEKRNLLANQKVYSAAIRPVARVAMVFIFSSTVLGALLLLRLHAISQTALGYIGFIATVGLFGSLIGIASSKALERLIPFFITPAVQLFFSVAMAVAILAPTCRPFQLMPWLPDILQICILGFALGFTVRGLRVVVIGRIRDSKLRRIPHSEC
jgi:hypothetical protein